MGFGIDHQNTYDGNQILLEGEYEMIVKAAYEDATKNGIIYLNITLAVRNDVEQKCKNKCLWHSLWKRKQPNQDDLKCDGYSAAQINTLSKAIGIENGRTFETLDQWCVALKGKPLLVTVKHEDFNGKPQAKANVLNPTGIPTCNHVFKSEAVAPAAAIIEDVIDEDDLPF